MEAAQRLGARFVAMGEPGYPKPLHAADTAPPMILRARQYCRAGASGRRGLSGRANASAAGLTFTGRLAADLAEAGFCVVSGLARGIDTAAHKAASAHTIAILAGRARSYLSLPEQGLAGTHRRGGWCRDFGNALRLGAAGA